MSQVATSPGTAQPSPTRGGVIAGVLGLVAGAVVGVLFTAIAVGWTLVAAVDQHKPTSFPLLIEVSRSGETVVATSGAGLFVPTLVAAAVGTAVALVIWAVRRRSA